jgi:hypothetical protein
MNNLYIIKNSQIIYNIMKDEPIKNMYFIQNIILISFVLFAIKINCQNNLIFEGFNSYFDMFGEANSKNNCNYNPSGLFSFFVPAKNGKDDGFSRFNFINCDYSCKSNWKGYETGPSKYGGSLRISIKDKNDISGGINKNDKNQRSRSELVFFPRVYKDNNYRAILKGDTSYLSLDCFIPMDSTFSDEIIKNSHHIIFQIHQRSRDYNFDTDGNKIWNEYIYKDTIITDPPLLLSIIHSKKEGHERDLHLSYGFRIKKNKGDESNKERGTSLILKDAITKGQWNNFKMKIVWNDNDSAYIKLWVNDKITFNTSRLSEKSINPNFNNSDKTIIYGANLVKDKFGKVSKPNIKFGHYRGGLNNSATFYYDDFIFSTDSTDVFSPFIPLLKDISVSEKGKITLKKFPQVDFYKIEIMDGEVFKSFEFKDEIQISKLNIHSKKEIKIRACVKLINEDKFRNFSNWHNLFIY